MQFAVCNLLPAAAPGALELHEFAPPALADCAPYDGSQAHSHFLPSLGRFGVVAPHAPGVESVHSPMFFTEEPCEPPVYEESLFPPPVMSEPLLRSPCVDGSDATASYSSLDFAPDPICDFPYDGRLEQGIYGDKYLNPVQRPLVEWGMPLYESGAVPPPSMHCGETNPSLPRFYVYGDYRLGATYIDGGRAIGIVANRLNLECDLWLTSTERFHMFTGPFQDGNDFMRVEFGDRSTEFSSELNFFDPQTDTLFFEGDLGYMIGGWTGQYAPFDLPFAVGLIPLLFQNGIWMEDAIVGVAATIPARNSPWLDWSNYDVTFFAGFDQVTSPAFGNAFGNNNSVANVVGATTFIEAKGGYIEAGYAFLQDTRISDRSYHNVGLSYTRRYLNLVSNSMRAIFNAGQEAPEAFQTADGVLLLAENSFLTPWPYNVIPYVNLFVGFDKPQSVARAGGAGGVLRNTGILFESDALTGYPTLNATGNDTYGAAFGVDLLAPGYAHQLILEAAVVQALDRPALAGVPRDEYGVGMRYQVPISHAQLLRFDLMHGWVEAGSNFVGARAEFRWKF